MCLCKRDEVFKVDTFEGQGLQQELSWRKICTKVVVVVNGVFNEDLLL